MKRYCSIGESLIYILYGRRFVFLLLRNRFLIEMPGPGPVEALHLRPAPASSLLCQLQFPTARIRIGRVRAAQEIEIAFTGKNRSVRSLSSFDTTHRCRRSAHPLSCGRSLLLVFKSNMSWRRVCDVVSPPFTYFNIGSWQENGKEDKSRHSRGLDMQMHSSRSAIIIPGHTPIAATALWTSAAFTRSLFPCKEKLWKRLRRRRN